MTMARRLATWSLTELTRRCAEETHKFRQQLLDGERIPHDTQYCYEIFYRAIAERTDEAWEHIVGLYQRQVETWIVRMPASTPYLDELEAMVNCVFIKFWRACRDKDLSTFPALESILAYLKHCARSTVHDWGPAAPASPTPLDLTHDPVPDPFLWGMLQSKCKTEKESVVMRDYFLYNLPPRDIFGQNPDSFASPQEVSRILQNILERLKRDDEVRDYFQRASR